jgi:hypothetical protein
MPFVYGSLIFHINFINPFAVRQNSQRVCLVIAKSNEDNMCIYSLTVIVFTSYITVTEFIMQQISTINSLASTVCVISGCSVSVFDNKTALCFVLFSVS